MEKVIKVNNTKKVFGNVKVPGSKNSSLALLSACCLTKEKVRLSGIPKILDFQIICSIGKSIGLSIDTIDEDTIEVNPAHIHTAELDKTYTSSFRASYYFVGALLPRFKSVSIGYPGGDDFVSRPIDQHVKGLKALGARFLFFKDHYLVEADELKGADIYFDVVTSGATINVILAASLAKGRTVLYNAARDPEVIDIANMINLMGGNVKGAGTSKIIINGVNELRGCDYQVIPDRLIASSLLMSVGVSKGEVQLDNVIPEHLISVTEKLKEAGVEINIGDNYIRAISSKTVPQKGIDIKTGMYPGFATDLQQPFTSLLLNLNGKSTVTDLVYPNRFAHVPELAKLGADIKIVGNTAIIKGGNPLYGGQVKATDVRAGYCLILAAMMAEGTTTISDIYHIERGYEDVISLLNSIDIDIKLEEKEIELGAIDVDVC